MSDSLPERLPAMLMFHPEDVWRVPMLMSDKLRDTIRLHCPKCSNDDLKLMDAANAPTMEDAAKQDLRIVELKRYHYKSGMAWMGQCEKCEQVMFCTRASK